MRRTPGKRESKKPKVLQASNLHFPYEEDTPCSLSQCFDSIIRCHREMVVHLSSSAVLRLPDTRFCLTRGQLQNLYEMQQGKCALTEVELKPCLYHAPERVDAIGLDFIRPNVGYIKSNSRLVCWPLAIGRAVRGDVRTRVDNSEAVYSQYNVQTKIYDRLPADDYLVRHALMMTYMEHLQGFNALKYYPIMAVLENGAITFKAYYFQPNQKRWVTHPRTRLEHTDFTRLFLDDWGNLLVARYKDDTVGPTYMVDYANPELDMCAAIDRAVISWFKIWYYKWAHSQY